jgi:uncharacterized iron-regulated membrane protein
MVRQAMETVPEPLERISVVNPRDAHASVVAVFEEPHGLSHEHPQVAFDGTTGEVREIRKGGLKPASKTFTTMVGLHEAHFAGPVLRLLFFLCGLGGCAMVATGLLLWTVARLPKPGVGHPWSLRLVEGLNIATIAGLPMAIAAYFLANRLLPVGLADRAAWEIRAFFAVWLAVALIAPFRPRVRAWPDMLSAAAALYAAVCVADGPRLLGAALDPAGLSWPPGLAFDGVMLGLAALLHGAARKAGSGARTAAGRAGPARASQSAA